MPKLYTKTGDKGTSSLYDGNRIVKHSIIFESLGTLDELSSFIGMLCSFDIDSVYYNMLRKIQVTLLDIGSNIAVVDSKRKKRVPKIDTSLISELEVAIDYCESKNSPLTVFLLTGSNQLDSYAHICRSITRRVERSLWGIEHDLNTVYTTQRGSIDMNNVNIDKNILVYINRLSDYFFALARNLSKGQDVRVSDYK